MKRDKNSGSSVAVVEAEVLGRPRGSKRRNTESWRNGQTGGPTTPQPGEQCSMPHERR